MINNTASPEERRLMILNGIRLDHTNLEIAAEMGVKKWVVLNDLRTMHSNEDPELKQAYIAKETRTHISTQQRIIQRNAETRKTYPKKMFSEILKRLPEDLLTEVTVLLQNSGYVSIKPKRLARVDWYRINRRVREMGG